MAKENVTPTDGDDLQSELESNFWAVVSGSRGAIQALPQESTLARFHR